MKKTSLADIASALGVSKTLVSMVLNNRGDEMGINTDTQKRVWAKASELNYQPNMVARGLRMGRSNTIGIIVADISNSFYAKICRSVEDMAAKAGYNLMICSSDEKAERETRLIQTLRERQVDGMIIATTQLNNSAIAQLKKDNFPFVLFDRRLARIDTDYIVVDNQQGAADAVDHLVALGHRKIGMLTISPSHLSTIAERAIGYKEALKTHDIRVNNALIREIPFDNIQAGVMAELRHLLKPPNSITALFTVNNHLATAVLECAQELQLSIPQDIALVSFDNVDMFKFCYPPVTAISQPLQAIGEEALKLLLEKIESKGKKRAPQHIILPTELVIRRSCGSFLQKL